eukprot:4257693-Prymnesium_polylepis.2
MKKCRRRTSRVVWTATKPQRGAPGLPTRLARVPTMSRTRYVPDLLTQSCDSPLIVRRALPTGINIRDAGARPAGSEHDQHR